MTFVHVFMLAGAALVAVPIVLHLVMRQQPRHLEFPALRFIKRRQMANRRQLRLRHLLLLALRCALIALLAMALARPTIRASGMIGDQEAPVAAALVFDTNPRMQYRHQNRTRIEAAQETALWLTTQLPPESEVAVLDSRTSGSAFAVDLTAAKQRIQRLAATAVPLALGTVLDDALRLLHKSEKQRKELYVFTDLARASWSPAAFQNTLQSLQVSPDVGIYVIDVGVAEPRDFGIGRVRVSEQVLSKNVPLRVQGELIDTGPGDERNVELYLIDQPESTPVKRSQATFKFSPGQSQIADFRVGGLSPGTHQGYLKLAGDDGLPCDDTAYFTVEIKPPWRVLIAAPPNADPLFLREALSPYDLRVKGAAAFACDVVNLDDIGKQNLDSYDAVCLLDPKPLPPQSWKQLSTYVARGGGLAICLGRNATLEGFNEPFVQDLLPAKLQRQWRSGEAAFAPENLQHPILAAFRDLESGVPWNSGVVFRHWQFGPLARDAGVIISYTDGQPALIERALGHGRVLTMTTPISDRASDRETWNVLPTNDNAWVFMILAQQMVKYVSGSADTRLNYTAGETAVLHLPANQHFGAFALTTPRGDQIRQPSDDKQHAVIVTTTDEPGNYRLRAGGQNDGINIGFSVNLPADVSQFERISDQDLKALFGQVPFRVARNRDEINRSVSLGRVGRELYPPLVLILALLLGAELVLANRFYRRNDQTAGQKPPPLPAAPGTELKNPLPTERVPVPFS